MGHSSINGGFFHCYVWVPESNSQVSVTFWWRYLRKDDVRVRRCEICHSIYKLSHYVLRAVSASLKGPFLWGCNATFSDTPNNLISWLSWYLHDILHICFPPTFMPGWFICCIMALIICSIPGMALRVSRKISNRYTIYRSCLGTQS